MLFGKVANGVSLLPGPNARNKLADFPEPSLRHFPLEVMPRWHWLVTIRILSRPNLKSKNRRFETPRPLHTVQFGKPYQSTPPAVVIPEFSNTEASLRKQVNYCFTRDHFQRVPSISVSSWPLWTRCNTCRLMIVKWQSIQTQK